MEMIATKPTRNLNFANLTTCKPNALELATLASIPPLPQRSLPSHPRDQLLHQLLHQLPALQPALPRLLLQPNASAIQIHQFAQKILPSLTVMGLMRLLRKASDKPARCCVVLAQKLATGNRNHSSANHTPKRFAPTQSLRSLQPGARCFATLAT